jgi:hypothetical protein
MHRTDYYTGWLDTNFSAMSAVITLCSGVAIGVDVERVVGTCLHTGFTANATRRIEVHNAILALK